MVIVLASLDMPMGRWHCANVADLIVREIEDIVAQKLRERALQHGVSPEEEHRKILREALLKAPSAQPKLSFKEYLLSMPNVGADSDFARIPGNIRDVDLSD